VAIGTYNYGVGKLSRKKIRKRFLCGPMIKGVGPP